MIDVCCTFYYWNPHLGAITSIVSSVLALLSARRNTWLPIWNTWLACSHCYFLIASDGRGSQAIKSRVIIKKRQITRLAGDMSSSYLQVSVSVTQVVHVK